MVSSLVSPRGVPGGVGFAGLQPSCQLADNPDGGYASRRSAGYDDWLLSGGVSARMTDRDGMTNPAGLRSGPRRGPGVGPAARPRRLRGSPVLDRGGHGRPRPRRWDLPER